MLVIFDLDDTLLDTFGSLTCPLAREIMHCVERDGWKFCDFERDYRVFVSMISSLDNFSDAVLGFMIKVGVPSDLAMYTVENAKVMNPLHFGAVVPLCGSAAAIKKISMRNNLILVTRGDPGIQSGKIELSGLPMDRFDRHIVCADKGVAYRDLLLEEGVDVESVLVFGDNVQRDLVPAKSLGFSTVHVIHGRCCLKRAGSKSVVDYRLRGVGGSAMLVDQMGVRLG